MRNLLSALICALLLLSCAQGNKEAKDTKRGHEQCCCGAFADYRALSNEDIQLFEAAFHYALKLTPQCVTTQVVAGTNYKFICKDKANNDIKVVIFQPLPNQGEARVTSIETLEGEDTQELVEVVAQLMYDDVMAAYARREEDAKYAFGRYASDGLKGLLDKVEAAITNGEIEPMMYGWDCDPWILAQDRNMPSAKVVKVHDFTKKQCLVDVTITDGETRCVTLTLVKEGKQWKVDDFATPAMDKNTFAKALQKDFDAALNSMRH